MGAALKSPSDEALYEALISLPPHVVGEIVGGRLYVSPRPSVRHANAATILGAELSQPLHRRPGGNRPGG